MIDSFLDFQSRRAGGDTYRQVIARNQAIFACKKIKILTPNCKRHYQRQHEIRSCLTRTNLDNHTSKRSIICTLFRGQEIRATFTYR